jgi:hypothetical protein
MAWTYDVRNSQATAGPDDQGILTIIGAGELTQIQTNDAIDAYYGANPALKLTGVVIGPLFDSLPSLGRDWNPSVSTRVAQSLLWTKKV